MDENDRALLAASTSLVVAIVGACLAAIFARRLARLNATLKDQELRLNSELNARFKDQELRLSSELNAQLKDRELRLSDELERSRSAEAAKEEYRYDALKRLYQECQPLIFQASEMAFSTQKRLMSLASSSREGYLLDWLARRGYYFRSTVYFFLAPITTVKILQRRLTTVDLSLDWRLQRQYEVLKQMFATFAGDFSLAKFVYELEYKPDEADHGLPGRDSLLRESPAVYARQGFYWGTLESIAEALIRDRSGTERCVSYGEFLDALEDPTSRLARVLPDIEEVFSEFHPEERPVLWRVLIAQGFLAGLLLRLLESESDAVPVRTLVTATGLETADLDWRTPEEKESASDSVVVDAVEAARQYVLAALGDLDRRIPPRFSEPT